MKKLILSQHIISIYFTQTADSISLEIGNNTFSNCLVSKQYAYSVSLILDSAPDNSEPILFRDNTINYDYPTKAAQEMFIKQSNREINIRNCSFRHCFKSGAEYWAKSIFAENLKNIIIEDRNFDNCGINNCGNIICVYKSVTKCRVENCEFYRTSNANNKCGSGIATYVDNCVITGNKFIRCADNAIRIQCKNQGDKCEIIDNYFTECILGNLISVFDSFNQTPIIKGNIFEKNQNPGSPSFIFRFNNNVEEITFENNTFKEHISKYGGFCESKY